MATISNLTLTLDQDVANMDITVTYTINWSSFDQLSNLPYWETWDLIGDDTGQDGDDSANPGDDPIDLGLLPLVSVSSNGQVSTQRTKTKTIAFSELQEDTHAVPGVGDDEIRAIVTLNPQLPGSITRESNLVTVNV